MSSLIIDDIPDDVFSEIFAHCHTPEPFSSNLETSPPCALRGVALSCRRFYNLAQVPLAVEIRWNGHESDEYTDRYCDSSATTSISRHISMVRKVVICVPPPKLSVHTKIYAALTRFLSLKELVLFNTLISDDETYPLLEALPSLRILAIHQCTVFRNFSDYGKQWTEVPVNLDHSRHICEFNLPKLTHLSMLNLSFGPRAGESKIHPLHLVFLPTLEEVTMQWNTEIAVKLHAHYGSPKSLPNPFRALTRLTVNIFQLDNNLAEALHELFHILPRHYLYSGPQIFHAQEARLKVHLFVHTYKTTQLRNDESQIITLGASVLSNNVLAGTLAPVTSYAGPLSALGFVVGPAPFLNNTDHIQDIGQRAWDKAERIPDDAAQLPAIDGIESVSSATIDHTQDCSGITRLVLKSMVCYETAILVHALTLLAFGRKRYIVGSGGQLIATTGGAKMRSPLEHIDIPMKHFNVEILHAIKSLYANTITTITLRMRSVLMWDATVRPSALMVYDHSMQYVGADILAHTPHLRSLLFIRNREPYRSDQIQGATGEDGRILSLQELSDEVRDYAVGWGYICHSLREVQVDGVRFVRRWRGDYWEETPALINTW